MTKEKEKGNENGPMHTSSMHRHGGGWTIHVEVLWEVKPERHLPY